MTLAEAGPHVASAGPSARTRPGAVFFIGDSITHGWRDEHVGGWPSRLSAAFPPGEVTAYNLGVRGDSSGDVLLRWQDEVARRRRPAPPAALVFAFGANDARLGPDNRPLTEPDVSRHNARAILASAAAQFPTLFIGPAPVDDATLARTLNRDGDVPVPHNEQVGAISAILAMEAAAAGVPYLDLFAALSGEEVWFAAIHETDGLHPPARGYDMIAKLVAAWAPWRTLFA